MSSNFIRSALIFFGAVILLAGAFSGGVIAGWAMPERPGDILPTLELPSLSTPVPQLTPGATPTPVDKETLFEPFWEAWDLVHNEYVDQPVNDLELMRGAIRGMIAALGDKHSSYMDPVQYEQQNAPLHGEYEGIGAWVDTTTDYVTIINPMPDSPAEAAGLKTGDMIIAVNGEDMTGIDGSLVLREILGPAGTPVTLTVVREGSDPFDVTIERAHIVVASVETEALENDIVYLQLTTYGDKTTNELYKALNEIMRGRPKGIVLDLRNNGGGYLNTAIDVVSQFIDSGVVMYEEYGDGTRRTYEANGNGLATQVPLVVLVNQGTASASEITAGAIQDYGRGLLVGTQTYGKGSVQNWIPLQDEQGAVRITIARWLTPNGRQIHGQGLTPDVVVELTEDDVNSGRDPQLDKAVELLISSGR